MRPAVRQARAEPRGRAHPPVSSTGPCVGRSCCFSSGPLPTTGRPPPWEADACGPEGVVPGAVGARPSVPVTGQRLDGALVFPTQRRTARKAGPRGRSGRSAPRPAGPAPSREAGRATSPATPAWARPSRRGHAAWASVTTAVSVSYSAVPVGRVGAARCPLSEGSGEPPGVRPGGWPAADGRVPVCASPAERRLEPLVALVILLCDLRPGQRHADPALQLAGAPDGREDLQGQRPRDKGLPGRTVPE